MTTTNGSLQDGINRHILTVLPELNRVDGVECAVCIVNSEGELANGLKDQGVKVYSFDAPHGHHWRAFVGFYRAVRDFKPDLMHDAVTCFAERIVARLFFPQLRWVSTYHGVRCAAGVAPVRNLMKRLMNRLLHLEFLRVFYVSQNCMEVDEGFGLYSSAIRRLGVNPINFKAIEKCQGKLRGMLGLDSDVPLVGTACRIAQIKRPDLFTEVMVRVLKENAQAHAVIMGEGPLLPMVKEMIDKSGVGNRFHLLGYRRDVVELDADLDVFVMTSELEGMPTSVVEAISLDVPVAIMKVPGGLTDIARLNAAKGPFAVVAEHGDVTTMVRGILKVLGDHALRNEYARKARAVCAVEYDVHRAVDQFIVGYREALGGI